MEIEGAVAAPVPRASSAENTVVCPACATGGFSCEACLHQHLQKVHGVRYSDVFGPQPNGWSDLCQAHERTCGSMLGL